MRDVCGEQGRSPPHIDNMACVGNTYILIYLFDAHIPSFTIYLLRTIGGNRRNFLPGNVRQHTTS